jgi:hypothetical protein
MTDPQVVDKLFLALAKCGDKKGEPIIENVETAWKLANALFLQLKEMALLKLGDQ